MEDKLQQYVNNKKTRKGSLSWDQQLQVLQIQYQHELQILKNSKLNSLRLHF